MLCDLSHAKWVERVESTQNQARKLHERNDTCVVCLCRCYSSVEIDLRYNQTQTMFWHKQIVLYVFPVILGKESSVRSTLFPNDIDRQSQSLSTWRTWGKQSTFLLSFARNSWLFFLQIFLLLEKEKTCRTSWSKNLMHLLNVLVVLVDEKSNKRRLESMRVLKKTSC